jgi:hypothetical protein
LAIFIIGVDDFHHVAIFVMTKEFFVMTSAGEENSLAPSALAPILSRKAQEVAAT